MQKSNILYIITKLELGGAQKQLLSLIAHLDKERFTPFLFTAEQGLLVGDARGIKGLNLRTSRALERPINLGKDILALWEIFRFIRRNNIGIVHTHSSKAGLLGRIAAKLAGVKIIIHTVHGWSFNCGQSRLRRNLFIRLERLAAGFCDKLIVVSDFDRTTGLSNKIGRPKQYTVIRYGIDQAEFSRANPGARGEFGISDEALVVGMVSCFKPQKSPLDYVRLASVFSKVSPGAVFLLIGDGALRENIERQISVLGLKKQFILTGWRRDIARLLEAIDVFVLTSLWEGMPIAVLEAMAASRPVIATDTGGIREVVIEGETGFLVHAGDVNDAFRKLLMLSEDASLRKKMGQRARESLGSAYSRHDMAKNTQTLYCSLIKSI